MYIASFNRSALPILSRELAPPIVSLPPGSGAALSVLRASVDPHRNCTATQRKLRREATVVAVQADEKNSLELIDASCVLKALASISVCGHAKIAYHPHYL